MATRKQIDDALATVRNQCNQAFVPTTEIAPVLNEWGITTAAFEQVKRRAKRGPGRAEAQQQLDEVYAEVARRKSI